MAFNPSKGAPMMDAPTERKNSINDPKVLEQVGYYPYNLTHHEIITPRFGEYIPFVCLETVPRDRHILREDSKTILNQIDGNVMNTINQYSDYAFVPLRALFPNNYEKLIPNPTKGADLPNDALPQIPLFYWLRYLLNNEDAFVFNSTPTKLDEGLNRLYSGDDLDFFSDEAQYALNILVYVSTMLSRGQLLDYLGVCLDNSYLTPTVISNFQKSIDDFYRALYNAFLNDDGTVDIIGRTYNLSLTENSTEIRDAFANIKTLAEFRNFLADAVENGRMFSFSTEYSLDLIYSQAFSDVARNLENSLQSLLSPFVGNLDYVNTSATPFVSGGFINPTRVLAYQMMIAEFGTNDKVDNIFNSELYYQNLRSIMYPADVNGFTYEPTFDYNGVSTEYDLLTTKSFRASLMADLGSANRPGNISRSILVISTLFILRRSLRYGDYFSTARPDMFAVGQTMIPVQELEGGGLVVSPVDSTRNTLIQRYLHSANISGSDFPNFFASFFGVIPSDLSTRPRFVGHRKVELQNQITNNTANDQGKQTTNLLGLTDNQGFDVFIDDFGVLMGVMSYDVLPIYTSGIDNAFGFSDRFDYFNPMLQNIGDQPISVSELYGQPSRKSQIFGYTVRNAEYKYKVSRAHGAAVNSLPGYVFRYPLNEIITESQLDDVVISPQLIRDKPYYFDQFTPKQTSVSPGEYFHFLVSCVNDIQSARPIQIQPKFLF